MSGDRSLTFVSSIARIDLLTMRSSPAACAFRMDSRSCQQQTGDVHEFGVLIEEQGERVGVAVVPRPGEQDRDVFRRSLCGGGKLLARPSAVEPHELGPVTVQDVGGHDALGPAFRQHHDHESTGPNILDVMRQVLELFELEARINVR